MRHAGSAGRSSLERALFTVDLRVARGKTWNAEWKMQNGRHGWGKEKRRIGFSDRRRERERGGNKVCGQRPGSTDWKPAPRAPVISQIVRSVIFCPRPPRTPRATFPSRFLSALFYVVLSCNVPRRTACRKMVPLFDGKRSRIVNIGMGLFGSGVGNGRTNNSSCAERSTDLW